MDLAAPSARRNTASGQAATPVKAFRDESHPVNKGDALLAEVNAFVESGRDGLAVMKLCERISADIPCNRAP